MNNKPNDKLGYQYAKMLVKNGKINKAAHFLFCVLRGYDWNGKNESYPSEQTLAIDCDCNDKAIRRQIKSLVDSGLIEVVKVKGNSLKRKSNYEQNVYKFKPDYTADFEALKGSKPESIQEAPQDAPTVNPEPSTPKPIEEPKDVSPTLFEELSKTYRGNLDRISNHLGASQGPIVRKHGIETFDKLKAILWQKQQAL